MNNAGNVAENRQDDIKPEMFADSDLEKHSKGRQDDRKNDFQQFHLIFLFVLFAVADDFARNNICRMVIVVDNSLQSIL